MSADKNSTADDLANRVLAAIQDKPEAVKSLSDALATRDPVAIRDAIKQGAGIDLSDEEAQRIVDMVNANPSRPAAYWT